MLPQWSIVCILLFIYFAPDRLTPRHASATTAPRLELCHVGGGGGSSELCVGCVIDLLKKRVRVDPESCVKENKAYFWGHNLQSPDGNDKEKEYSITFLLFNMMKK